MRVSFDSPAGCILAAFLVCLGIVFLPVILAVLLIAVPVMLLFGTPIPFTGARFRQQEKPPEDDGVIDVEAEVVDEKKER